MRFALAILAGVMLALPYVLYARRVRDRRRVFGIGLIVAALIYVVFALVGDTVEGVLIELGGVVLFGMFAFLGDRCSVYFLALGWVAHVCWDVLLHPIANSSYAPWWYPVACIGFDLVVAAAIVGFRTGTHRRPSGLPL